MMGKVRFLRTIEVELEVDIGGGQRMEELIASIDASTFISTNELENLGAVVTDSGWMSEGGVK
jgi:hypothetical protein